MDRGAWWYSPFSREESETTEQLTLSLMTQEGGGN